MAFNDHKNLQRWEDALHEFSIQEDHLNSVQILIFTKEHNNSVKQASLI